MRKTLIILVVIEYVCLAILFCSKVKADDEVTVRPTDHCYHEVIIDTRTGKFWRDPELTCESTPDDWKQNQ